ncbi:MAG: hypothetical protein OHK0012_05920 [Synechococcales cyanobacterium]
MNRVTLKIQTSLAERSKKREQMEASLAKKKRENNMKEKTNSSQDELCQGG